MCLHTENDWYRKNESFLRPKFHDWLALTVQDYVVPIPTPSLLCILNRLKALVNIQMIAAFCQKEVCHVRVCRLPVQSWANILAYLVNLGITYGSLTGAFGATNEELSEKYQSLVTPAGYAFAIWGAIFTWEGIFAVAQMCPPLSTSPVVDTVTPWWIFACCFQVAWTLFFAQDRILEALICMLGILLSLLTSILRTDFPARDLPEGVLLAEGTFFIALWMDHRCECLEYQRPCGLQHVIPRDIADVSHGALTALGDGDMCFPCFALLWPGHGILSKSDHVVQHRSELLICSRTCHLRVLFWIHSFWLLKDPERGQSGLSRRYCRDRGLVHICSSQGRPFDWFSGRLGPTWHLCGTGEPWELAEHEQVQLHCLASVCDRISSTNRLGAEYC